MDGSPQVVVMINNGITAEEQDRFEDRVIARFERISRRFDQMSERFDAVDAKMADLRGSVTGLIGIVRDARAQAEATAATLTAQIEELKAGGAGSADVITALTIERDTLLDFKAGVDADVTEVLDSATATDDEVDAAAMEFGGDPGEPTPETPPFPETAEGAPS